MIVCECILSDDTHKHIRIIQKILQKDYSSLGMSDTVAMLLRYIISDVDMVSVNDLFLIDDYFLEHPLFLYQFKNDVMMSATFY